MNNSAIEWTDRTWNPVSGCSKVSQGCKHCYAERLWPRVEAAERKREHLEWNEVPPRPFTTIRLHPDRLDQPLRIRKPQRIFVNSMSDLFHEDVPDAFILQVFDVMRECCNGYSKRTADLVRDHTFQILTKRPARTLDFCTRLRFAQNDERGLYLANALPHNGFNPMAALTNVHIGVSIEDQETADQRIPLLLQTPAAVRFISAEPLLDEIRLTEIHYGDRLYVNTLMRQDTPEVCIQPSLDWVITGGESGPGARPSHPGWFRRMRDDCASFGVPFFFKQWGEWAPETVATSERAAREAIYLQPDGSLRPAAFGARNSATTMQRNGKRSTGRELDGRTHDAFPITE